MNAPSDENLFDEISRLSTEQRNPKSIHIDLADTKEILRIINDEDKTVPYAIEIELPYIEKAVEVIVNALKNGGRLLYFGAGTSGRLGIIDAAECPPTFGTAPELIKGYIAGGKNAMFVAQEGAEDLEENGANDVTSAFVNSDDVVCGIAASKRTPYVIGAIKKAKELGAKTLFLTCNPRSEFKFKEVDISICPYVGPEVIMGSTRMKSGTAQKLVLNMLTTAAMIKLGKVYENMMIDLQLTNKKLIERAKRIIMTITNVSYKEADEFLRKSGGHVKTALIMIKANVTKEEAEKRLESSSGFVRSAIDFKK